MHDVRSRRLATVALAAVVVGLVAASAWAANIAGSARNDTLRGTARADRITGGAGNDKLYGLGGNDVLLGGPGNDLVVGGPGADVLNCGAGRDTAVADKSDKVVGCEVVKGLPKPPPPTVASATVDDHRHAAAADCLTVDPRVVQGRNAGREFRVLHRDGRSPDDGLARQRSHRTVQ